MEFTVHVPILVKPILSALLEPFRKLTPGSRSHWIVDCTLGGGGHTSAFLEAFQKEPSLRHHRVLALDQDSAAVERAKKRFAPEMAQGQLEVVQARFGELTKVVGDRPVLGLMADLGFSSDQMDLAVRGLSFQKEGPLDMRLDPSRGVSCRDLLSQVSEAELESWLSEYGEERFSRKIASAVIQRRREGRLPSTTKELVDTIVHAVPSSARHGKIHVATRTFQALRIVVNEEMAELEALLNDGICKLLPGGRVAIISFHSLEDRKVKHRFVNRMPRKEGKYESKFKAEADWENTMGFGRRKVNQSNELKGPVFLSLTKKPIQPDQEELRMNPRSRSAKLRIAERVELEA